MATIFALLEPNDGLRESLTPVLSRRVRYLEQRALRVSERGDEQSRSSAWTMPMVKASLWLEAAEAAVAMGEFVEAKRHLRRATELFLRLQLPFGAVLQRGFSIDGEGLDALSHEVLRVWHGQLEIRNEYGDRPFAGPATGLRAEESPQQWAYVALANALDMTDDPHSEIDRRGDHPNLENWRMVPIGRMRLPLNFYHFIVQELRSARLSDGNMNLTTQQEVADTIGKALTGLFRAAQWARGNDYLWTRLLAPVPLFDFDTAALIACVLRTPGGLANALEQRLEGTVPTEAMPYAREFIAAVRSLDSRPRPRGFASAM